MGIVVHGDALDQSAQDVGRLGASVRIVQRCMQVSYRPSIDLRKLWVQTQSGWGRLTN